MIFDCFKSNFAARTGKSHLVNRGYGVLKIQRGRVCIFLSGLFSERSDKVSHEVQAGQYVDYFFSRYIFHLIFWISYCDEACVLFFFAPLVLKAVLQKHVFLNLSMYSVLIFAFTLISHNVNITDDN